MRVRVDETGRHGKSGADDRDIGCSPIVPDCCDPIVLDPDVARGRRALITGAACLLIAAVIIAVFATCFALITWAERKILGRIQNRYGPNRVGPFGLLQSLMDGLKLAFKEEIIPVTAHLAVYWIAPVISATTAFLTFAVIPFGPEVSILGHVTQLQLTDFPVSVLYVLAIASVSLGATRRFDLRRVDDSSVRVGVELHHGDLLVMRGAQSEEELLAIRALIK